ncbi:MAG: extensin family protein [Alphaproteobacteria bacterium]
MWSAKNEYHKKLLFSSIFLGLLGVSYAYATTIPGLEEILKEADEATQNITTSTTSTPQTPVPHVEQSTDGQGSVFVFPSPSQQQAAEQNNEQNTSTPSHIVPPPPSREAVSTQTAQSTENIQTIIGDDEIQRLLGDGPLADHGPDHQVVRIPAEYVPVAPPRPLDSILDEVASQPVVVDAPDNLTKGILTASMTNPALKGRGNKKIVILTPPPRPKGLKNPSSLAQIDQDDIVVASTSSSQAFVTSSGRLKIRYQTIRYQKIGRCNIRNVRKVTGVGQASIVPAAIMKKDLSVKIAQFERDVVQPAARRYYGVPVTQMKQLSSFRCTNIAGTRTLSEHTKANALDVSTFVFADGRSVNLVKGWRGSSRERKFLRELQKGACGIFGTTLTPNYNRDHYNHFHLDNKIRKSKNICK